MNNNTSRLFLPALLGFLMIPYGYFAAWITGTMGDFFFFGFALTGLLFYGLWWAFSKLCTKVTQRPGLSILLLNGLGILLFFPVLFGWADSGFLFTSALPLITLPSVMLPSWGSSIGLYGVGLLLALIFSFLGCTSVRNKK